VCAVLVLGLDRPLLAQSGLLLEGLPPARPLEALTEEAAPPPAVGEATVPKRHPWIAAGTFTGLIVLPWVFDRYASNEPYAHISWGSIGDNLKSGLTLEDPDKFSTDQLGHPVSGGFFFNAGRSNGYSFWRSIPYAAAGGFIWQMAAERNAHSLNDFFTTAMGGPTLGEPFFRLARLVVDTEVQGTERVLREIAGGLLNPMQTLTRFITGELTAVQPNPADRAPSKLVATLDLGYRHLPEGSQGILKAGFRYGDPFDKEGLAKPFDFFELSVEISGPSHLSFLTGADVRGLVAASRPAGSPRASHVLGVFLEFDYQNNEPRVFGRQSVTGGLLSTFDLGGEAQLLTEALGVVTPLASLATGHEQENFEATGGRTFDWGPGAGFNTVAHLRRREVDLVSAGWSIFWMHSSSGVARNSVVQSFFTEGRVPLGPRFALGGSFTYRRRLSTYDEFETAIETAHSFRAFGAVTFR
jgi:Domain of unknown function (DUF3943)